jgi:hypothetical protein
MSAGVAMTELGFSMRPLRTTAGRDVAEPPSPGGMEVGSREGRRQLVTKKASKRESIRRIIGVLL